MASLHNPNAQANDDWDDGEEEQHGFYDDDGDEDIYEASAPHATYYPGINVCIVSVFVQIRVGCAHRLTNLVQVCQEKPPYSKGGKSYPTCGMRCARIYEQLKNTTPSILTQTPTRSPDGASLRRIGSHRSPMRAASAIAGPSRRSVATVDDLSQGLHSLSFQNTPTRKINTSPCVVSFHIDHLSAHADLIIPQVCLVGFCRDDKYVTCGVACAEVLCKTGSANPNNCNVSHRRISQSNSNVNLSD